MENSRAEKLANSFARAQKLTQAVSSPEFDKYVKKLSDNGYMELDEDIEGQLGLNSDSGRYDARRELNNIRNNKNVDFSKSKLPKKILDEIKDNPLDGLSVDPTMDSFARNLSEKITKNEKPVFSEMANRSNTEIQAKSSTDYEMIKMIVEGVVKKYMEPIKNNLLTEGKSANSNSVDSIILGKKFKFVDSSGNIYEAVLKYKGNVNSMNKK